MKFFTTDKIRQADAYTIKNEPVQSVGLMERAALQLCDWIMHQFHAGDQFMIFAGPGNNGGDAWALARLLWNNGFKDLKVYQLDKGGKLSTDAEINRSRFEVLAPDRISVIRSQKDFPEIHQKSIIIDGLFGSGLSRPLEDMAAELVSHLNNSEHRKIIAIDIPSGLAGEENSALNPDHVIHADITLTFQFPKLAFFFPENEKFVGEFISLPIGLHKDFISNEETLYNYITDEDAGNILRIRRRFSHKGTYGHALLIAGSYGMTGAAVLAARAAIKAGTGLLTTHIPRKCVEIVQVAVPESLISIDESDIIFTGLQETEKFTAAGIGPGLNQKPNTKKGLVNLLHDFRNPMVIDADALNILGATENWAGYLPDNVILTPHPKEYERLFGKQENSFKRLEQQLKFSIEHRCVIVLKGAYTCITTPQGKIWFNTSGNPGMARGGSGDVLTGMILGILAQGYSATDAAILGVYLHGKAGDLAASENGVNGLTPSDIIHNMGKAFRVIEQKYHHAPF